MDRETARQYRERWQLVESRLAEERRARTVEERFRQFCALQDMAARYGFLPAPQEVDEVRERWRRLRSLAADADA